MLFHTVLNNKKEIYSKWLNEPILNLVDSTFVIPQEYQYEILEVSDRYISRPDLLAYDVYGDTLYTDLLCKLNGISNPFELNKGMLIIVPSPDCIMDFMKTVSIEDMDDSIGNSKPLPKKKTEKRQPNEAILGDYRFKIDKTRGIIVY